MSPPVTLTSMNTRELFQPKHYNIYLDYGLMHNIPSKVDLNIFL